MRVLVTGGAGYIGAHTVRALARRGDAVTVLDDLSSGHPEAIAGRLLVIGSVVDGSAARDAIAAAGADAVVHLAALKSVEESLARPERYFEVNVGGTLAVLEAVAEAGVRAFVYSSSCAVYGTPDRLPVDEVAELRPENPYGESKLMAERLLPWFERRYGIRSVALRYFNAAGADPAGDIGESWDTAANLIPRAMRAAFQGTPIEVYGTDYDTPDGTAIRDYIHVDDLAAAHLSALDHLAAGLPSVTLNVGTGRGASVKEVLAEVATASGRTIDARPRPRRTGDPAAVWADPSAAARVLGWQAARGLPDIMTSAWRWHAGHPAGYGSTTAGAGERG